MYKYMHIALISTTKDYIKSTLVKFVGTVDSHVGYVEMDFTQIIFLLIS